MPADLATRADLRSVLPFAVLGSAGVVGGGLLAAVTAHDTSREFAWATAYLVLVVGVAQIALGAGQDWLAAHTAPPRLVAAECLGWNAGSAGVLAGTLLPATVLVDVGGALLLATLAGFAYQVRGGRTGRRRLTVAYHLAVAVLALSVPVGLVLARVTP